LAAAQAALGKDAASQAQPFLRHCEERSDEAIQVPCALPWIASLCSQ
jgi:hypothetical protein